MSTFEEMKACSIIIDKHVSNCPYLYELVLEVLDLGRPLKFVDSAKHLVEKNFTALCPTWTVRADPDCPIAKDRHQTLSDLGYFV